MPKDFFEEIGEVSDEVLLGLREKVAKGFSILEASTDEKVLSCNVTPLYSHRESFSRVFEEFEDSEYVPLYRRTEDGLRLIVVHKREASERRLRPVFHFLLLFATLLTMTWAGYRMWANGDLALSVVFAVSLMAILGVHETGHALMARRRKVKATLPFFIPVPPQIFPFGTMGAVIFMNSPIKDRRALLEVGVAGPIAGFLLSIPILLVGLKLSTVMLPIEALDEGGFILGSSLFFQFLVGLFFEISPGLFIDLHPLATAGWIGIFVTSLNLLPMGQLDGGHVVRGLMTKHYRKLYFGIALLLMAIGLFWPGWIIWPLFVWLITRFEHPGPLDDVSELDLKTKLLALVALVILVLCFMPVPILPAELLQLENF